jgi:hypothetical protein
VGLDVVGSNPITRPIFRWRGDPGTADNLDRRIERIERRLRLIEA